MLVSPADLVAKAKARISECSIRDVEACLAPDTLLVDIREPAEYQRGHIPGATLIPRGLLEFEIHTLVDRHIHGKGIANADTPIVLYCGTGGRSALAAESVQNLGYGNVRSMAGGIVAWSEAGLPLE